MPVDLLKDLEGTWEDGKRPRDVYAARIAPRPKPFVPLLLGGLASKKKRVAAGCAELCSLLSADRPELLWPHVDVFRANLASKEPVLRWEAACTVGNLAAVDDGRIAKAAPILVELLEDKSIVLQGHAARALAKIGVAHPKLARGILDDLFARADRFPGNRVGVLIEAAERLADAPDVGARITKVVTPYVDSDVPAVKKKAMRVLKKLARAR